MDEDKIYDELFEMSSIGPKTTGIEKVIIWVGPNASQPEMRIKVCNTPDKISIDTFSITIPDLQIAGKINEKFITPELLERIKKWILVNQKAIEDYSNREIFTYDFLLRIKKV